jgi:hypothetical protein
MVEFAPPARGGFLAHDVFVSYSTKDKTTADSVCARLEAHGIRCWIAPRDVLPGQVWGEAIVNAIQSSRAMVLVLSANANSSDHIPKEVELACAKGVIVIPFRIEDVTPARSLDYFLSNVHWLDALTTPLEQHIEHLAIVLQKILGEAPSPRPVPVPPLPGPIPKPIPRETKSTVPTGKLIAIAGAAVAIVAIVVLGVVIGRQVSSPPAVYHNEVKAVVPNSQSVEPAGVVQRQDPIVGCWQWTLPVPGPVVIRSNGTITAAGSVNGHWSNLGGRKYRFNWADPVVDDLFVTPDGQRMSGKNQYGYPTSAVRLTNAGSFAGTWRWYNNVVVTTLPNGTLSAGTMTAHWRVKNPSANEYTITWPAPTDTVTLNGTSLAGSNQFGAPIAASKGGGCGG